MPQILYHHINITNKDSEIEYLKELQHEGFFIIGIEITDPDIEEYCPLSIDPQHSLNYTANNRTSIEYVFNYQLDILPILSSFSKIFMITIKPDMDSIGSMAVLSLLLNNSLKLNGDLILRLKAIAKSDRHGRINWKNRQEDYFHFENYNIYGLPCGLTYMTANHRMTTEEKVNNMIEYLETGDFPNLEKYNRIIIKNIQKYNNSTNVKVIVNKKLSFVESKHRGAISCGYKYTPCVIAKNEQFKFGKGLTRCIGKKITIAQYEDKPFMDLNSIKSELNKIESGWGGSSVIIGSPQSHPCKIDDDVIIEITKKYLN